MFFLKLSNFVGSLPWSTLKMPKTKSSSFFKIFTPASTKEEHMTMSSQRNFANLSVGLLSVFLDYFYLQKIDWLILTKAQYVKIHSSFLTCVYFFVALNTKEKRARGIRSAQRKRMSTIRWNVSPIVHIGMSHVGILYIP